MYSVHDPLARGLPHSDIHGSKPVRGSPWLFAAYHVLHRLLVPRHPPNALLILTPSIIIADETHAQKPATPREAWTDFCPRQCQSHSFRHRLNASSALLTPLFGQSQTADGSDQPENGTRRQCTNLFTL